jgi:hypothetical protein
MNMVNVIIAIHHVYGAHEGKKRVVTVSSARNTIARLESLQFIWRLYDGPTS